MIVINEDAMRDIENVKETLMRMTLVLHRSMNDSYNLNISTILDNTAKKRFNSKSFMDAATAASKTISDLNIRMIPNDTLVEINRVITQCVKIMDVGINHISSHPHMSECENNIDRLKEEIDRLGTINEALENQIIQLNLEIAKSTERITDQTYRINTLTANERHLNKRIADLTKLNEQISMDNSNMADRLKEKTVSYDHLVNINITNFADIPFIYSLEHLNQYMLTGTNIHKSANISEVISHAVECIENTEFSEPIYIVSMLDNRIFSRFNVNNAYDNIRKNTFLSHMSKDKIGRKTFITVIEQEVSVLNKSIYSVLQQSGGNDHDEQ